jgi:hypothetical protein
MDQKEISRNELSTDITNAYYFLNIRMQLYRILQNFSLKILNEEPKMKMRACVCVCQVNNKTILLQSMQEKRIFFFSENE